MGAAVWAPPIGRRRVGARQLDAVAFGRRTFGRHFPILLYFSSHEEKNHEVGNSLNAVELKPVPTRVLNPNAS